MHYSRPENDSFNNLFNSLIDLYFGTNLSKFPIFPAVKGAILLIYKRNAPLAAEKLEMNKKQITEYLM